MTNHPKFCPSLKNVPNQFEELEMVFEDILSCNPRFVEDPVAELERVRSGDKDASDLLSRMCKLHLVEPNGESIYGAVN